MKIYYILDEHSLVHPVCDFRPDMEPESEWSYGEIDDMAYEEHGIPVYKEVNGNVVPRSEEEIQEDIDELPVPEPTEAEQLRADVDYLLMIIDEE